MKKILMILLTVIILITGIGIGGEKVERKYIVVYKTVLNQYDQLEYNQVANIVLSKWSITKNVYDLDVSNFEGYCETDITNGFIFVMNDKYGNVEYSGFMKNIIQDKNKVTFKGEDFKNILNTEILLDFTQTPYEEVVETLGESYYSLTNIFNKVREQVSEAMLDANGDENYVSNRMNISYTVPTDLTNTIFLGNYIGTYFMANALEFLKTYLAYYNYYIKTSFNPATKYIEIEFKKNSNSYDVRLEDFSFASTSTAISTNHTAAKLEAEAEESTEYQFVYSAEEMYMSTPAAYQQELNIENADPNMLDGYTPVSFNSDAQNYDADIVFTALIWEGTAYESTLLKTFFMQLSTIYTAKANTVSVNYYLGKDNNIYYNEVPLSQLILPPRTKIFLNTSFVSAQFDAVWELVNSRYNENVILDDVNSPINVKDFELYDMLIIHDMYDTIKSLPVTQIKYTQKSYAVKLGFKKTLLTEIIK